MSNDHISGTVNVDLDTEAITLKRNPRQERSRQRVERLLEVAESLIGQYGNTSFSMRELAVQAGMPIATAYQYFANQDAVIRQLAIRYHETFLEWMKESFGAVATPDAFFETIMEAVHSWIQTFQETPSYRALWSGTQGSEVLRKLDAEDTRRYARVVADSLLRLKPEVGDSRAFAAALLLCDSTTSVTRLVAASEPDERERLVEEFEMMVKLYLKNLLG